MVDWSLVFRIFHVVGTAIGVGAATFLEIFAIYFGRDKKVDIFEHEVLKICIKVLRLGLIILAISGFGLLMMARLRMLGPESYYASRMLAKMSIVLILLAVALLMNFRLINLKVGSAISTTSWYAALVLGLWRGIKINLFWVLLIYICCIVIVYFILEFFRKITAKKT